MSAADGENDGDLALEGAVGGVPAPGAALRAAVCEMKAVRTRAPARSLAAVLAAGAAVAALMAAKAGVRGDLGSLPPAWVVAMALAWAAGALAPLAAAVLPPRGAVLPDTARAGRVAAGTAAALVLLGLLGTVDAEGHGTVPAPAGFLAAWWHCVRSGLAVSVPVLVAALVAARRLHPVGEARVAAALGAAGGALGGLMLHFVCPVGGGLHVGLAHAGGVALAALVGMAALPRFLRA